ncbi:MAG: nuclear transport factor 2 family protein [Candidatus Latescibacteria bacterium]|nr:nuclear transport factor 2 family protein [Candidatus Latescibacterota bacterium]
MPVDHEKLIEQLRKQHDKYAQAWNDKDFDTISSMWAHDDDITMWDASVRKRIVGWEGPNGVKAWYQRAFNSMVTVDFTMQELLIKVTQDGTCAVFTLYIENNFTDKEGNKVKVNPRVTVVKELRDGEWKLIHGDASYSTGEMSN